MLDFPNGPSNGQLFQSGSQTWQFDGTKWIPVGTPNQNYQTLITVTAAFTTPAVSATVVVSVNDATGLVVGVPLFIVDAYYVINSIAGNNLTLQRTA